MLEALKYEWNLLTRERLLFLIVMMIAASTYALMIGNLYWGGTVQRIPTAVCDLEDSALSREFIRAVADVDQLNYVETLNDDMAALDRLENNKAAVVLVIPKDFSARFYSNRPIEIAALQDGSNIIQASYALSPIQSVVGTFAARMSVRAAMSHSTPQLSPMPVSMSLRTFGNPTQSYLEFYIFGVMLMAEQTGVMFNFSMSIFRDKKNPPPFEPSKVLAAKEIIYVTISLASVMLGFVVLMTLFELPFRAEPTRVLIIYLVGARNDRADQSAVERATGSLRAC